MNIGNRPTHAPGLAGRAALAGHLALYALMALAPLIALIRAYGGGRGFSFFGIEVFAPSEQKVE